MHTGSHRPKTAYCKQHADRFWHQYDSSGVSGSPGKRVTPIPAPMPRHHTRCKLPLAIAADGTQHAGALPIGGWHAGRYTALPPRIRACPSRSMRCTYALAVASNSGSWLGHWLGPWILLLGCRSSCGISRPKGSVTAPHDRHWHL